MISSEKTLKIGLYTPSFLPKYSGAEIFHHNLATRLVKRGHQVKFILPQTPYRQWKSQEKTHFSRANYTVERFTSLPWKLAKRFPDFGRFLARRALSELQSRHGFDLWHVVCTWPTGTTWIDWHLKTGQPGLLRAVGDDLSISGEVGLLKNDNIRNELKQNISRVPALVSLSAKMTQDYLNLGALSEQIHEIPNAVDLERFNTPFSEEDRVATRERRGLHPHKLTLLSVGRVHPQKNYDLLIRVYARLAQENFDFQAIIAGRDSLTLVSKIQEAGLCHHVRFAEISPEPRLLHLPPRELINLYRASDAMVMPSVLEGFSTALLEAAAAGLPLVTTDGAGCGDFIRHGQDGLMLPVNDEAALYEALKAILSDPGLRESLSKKAKLRAKSFSWDRTLSHYEALYEQVRAPRLKIV